VNRWKDEGELWEFMATRLRGWWRRLEATYPEGLPDAFGLFDQRTHWLELKVGRPSRDAFEPKQIEFTADKEGIFPIICQLHPAHVGGELVVLP